MRIVRIAALVSLAGCALLVVRAGAQSGNSLFHAATHSLTVPGDLQVVEDLNGDGRLDLVLVSYFEDLVSVMLGQPNGGLAGHNAYPVGDKPSMAIAGDFNGDGEPDVVTTNSGGHSVTVLLGQGDGSFVNQGSFGAVINPSFGAAADFDGDGNLDVAVLSVGTSATLRVLLGDGAGNLAVTPLAVPLFPSGGMIAADFDGDAAPDLALAHGSTVEILRGAGDGSFASIATVPMGSGIQSLRAVDLDLDGILDLLVANGSSSTLARAHGNGDGSFAPASNLFAGQDPYAIAVGDLTGDGLDDLAVTHEDESFVSVLRAKGDGGFAYIGEYDTSYVGRGLAIGDFSGDGRNDVLMLNYSQNFEDVPRSASILRGLGGGILGANASFEASCCLVAIATGDFDEDGIPDMVSTRYFGPDALILHRGLGDGSFEESGVFPISSGLPERMLVEDLDLDGHLDVVVGSEGAGGIVALLGDGDGGFVAADDVGTDGDGVEDLASGDFNGDGFPDLVGAFDGFGIEKVVIFLSQGNGSFAVGDSIALADPPTSVVAADLNGDGALDLAIGSFTGGFIVRLGVGDGSFFGHASALVGSSPRSVLAADFDGDGNLDLAGLDYDAGDALVVLGQGDGTFVDAGATGITRRPLELIAGDFDVDGDTDLAAVSATDSVAGVLLGQGDGSFVKAADFAADEGSTKIASGDFNLDGKPDLAIANEGSDRITILLNQRAIGWSLLGYAWGGSLGAPQLTGQGSFAANTANALKLKKANTSAQAALFVGASQVLLPFKGGILVPMPSLMIPLGTSPAGTIDLPFVLPNLPSGTALYFQFWIKDPLAAFGLAGSNGLKGLVP